MTRVGIKLLKKRNIRKVPLAGKRVLVRVDFNVPMTDNGQIDDDFRIRASLPTIERLLKDNCTVILIAHLGRPEGKRNLRYSLEPAAQRLAELLKRDVRFVDDCIGYKAKVAVKQARPGSVTVLENLRFHPGEEQNDDGFAQALVEASGASYFVQDGFGAVHRAHASTDAITHYLPSVAGLLLEREYETIQGSMQHPRRPLVALLGGAKVSDKIQVINELVRVADQIIIGGAMANTFLAYHGRPVGKSKIESGQKEEIDKIYHLIEQKVSPEFRENFLVLPDDVAVGHAPNSHAKRRNVGVSDVAEDDIILDIGDASIERMVNALHRAQTVIWNGTLGMAELPAFAHGSARAALILAQDDDKTSVIGGGDTADFVINWDARKGDSFTHVSTGGGASMQLMAGKSLPGIEALLDA